MPPTRKQIDWEKYSELRSQGLSNRRIAKELGIPESTLRGNISPKIRVLENEGTQKSTLDIPLGQKVPQEIGIPKVNPRIHETEKGILNGDIGIVEADIGIPLDTLRIPEKDLGIPLQEISTYWPGIRRMFEWWKSREELAAQKPEKLERFTFHMDPKWMELIKREADLSGETYAAVVNRAFSKYFGGS